MVVDLLVSTSQALKGQGHLDHTAQGEDQMGWMPQPFWQTLQGCLLLSESCDSGKTLSARGPRLCQAWEAGGGYAGTLITAKHRFGKAKMSNSSRKDLAVPWGFTREVQSC